MTRLDIYASASGRVQLLGQSKIVQPTDTGRIRSILVENGSHVTAGQPVIELDNTEILASLAAATHEVQSSEAEIARNAAEIERSKKWS